MRCDEVLRNISEWIIRKAENQVGEHDVAEDRSGL